jgi:hypothetical protein
MSGIRLLNYKLFEDLTAYSQAIAELADIGVLCSESVSSATACGRTESFGKMLNERRVSAGAVSR